jgi:hypothetical protein
MWRLCHLSMNGASDKMRILTEGGLTRVFAAMDRHVDVARVQAAGCTTLHDLASCAGDVTLQGALTVLQFLAADLRPLLGFQSMVPEASDSPQWIETLNRWSIMAEAGCFRRLKAVLSRADFPVNTRLRAAFALSSFALSELSKRELCADGGASMVVALLRENSDEAATLYSPCHSGLALAVCCLASQKEAVPLVLDGGGLALVLSLLSYHPDDRLVVEYSLLAIGMFCVSGDGGAATVRSSGAVHHVRAAVSRFPDNRTVQTLAATIRRLVATTRR